MSNQPMNRRRNVLDEIEEIRYRNPLPRERTWNPGWAAMRQMECLTAAMENASEDHPETWKFFVIGLVTCLENAFRLSIEFLIDSGEPYSKRAAGLTETKFKIEDILEMQGRKVSIGAVIAHLLSINSIEDINHSMSVLFDCQNSNHGTYLKMLESARTPDDAFSDVEEWTGSLVENFADVKKAVVESFKRRHIYVHELVSAETVIPSEVRQLVNQGTLFAQASLQLIDQILFPGMHAMTQAAMNDGAYQELSRSIQRMETAYEAVKRKHKNGRKLSIAQETWIRYKDAQMKATPNPYQGGSASPLFDAPARATLYDQRSLVLENDLETLEWIETL